MGKVECSAPSSGIPIPQVHYLDLGGVVGFCQPIFSSLGLDLPPGPMKKAVQTLPSVSAALGPGAALWSGRYYSFSSSLENIGFLPGTITMGTKKAREVSLLGSRTGSDAGAHRRSLP